MANFFTRFRAYQLGNRGSSFSYAVDGNFTLIEARYNDMNRKYILSEMGIMGCQSITTLHITSWDEDHCEPCELKQILQELKPTFIECPGYEPDGPVARSALQMINAYKASKNYAIKKSYTPDYIKTLEYAEERKFSNIIYNPLEITGNHNNDSTVTLFRRGRFTVLSLGDCESPVISERIANSDIIRNETDVMIIAHHGADNGFTTPDFLKKVNPRIAICSSNYDNQFDHPKQEIRDMLYHANIPLYTTKTGDVVVMCGDNNVMRVVNLCSDSQNVSSVKDFKPKCTIG